MSSEVQVEVQVDVQLASNAANIPNTAAFTEWVSVALEGSGDHSGDAELSIRIVDNDESQALNREYRQKDKPTNVLSFPADIPEFVNIPLLGDLVICAPIVEHEANAQGKTLTAHWAHMVIHGTLHLIGYDHIDDGEAEIMEALEVQLLAKLGFSSPYANDAS